MLLLSAIIIHYYGAGAIHGEFPLNEFGSLLQEGVLDDFGTGIYVLLDSRHYDAEIGLQIEMQPFGIFL